MGRAPADIPEGFVVAMRGRLVVIGRRARRRQLDRVWLVLSRFGSCGSTLAIGVVGVGGDEVAPPRLMPRLTLLGRHAAPRTGRAGLYFDLLDQPPSNTRFAGRWCAAAGRLQICGGLPELDLFAVGQLVAGTGWRFHGTQRPWIGAWPDGNGGRRLSE